MRNPYTNSVNKEKAQYEDLSQKSKLNSKAKTSST